MAYNPGTQPPYNGNYPPQTSQPMPYQAPPPNGAAYYPNAQPTTQYGAPGQPAPQYGIPGQQAPQYGAPPPAFAPPPPQQQQPPLQQQQQQRNQVVFINTGPAMYQQKPVVKESHQCAVLLACFVCCCCNCPFGLLAFLLAMVARNVPSQSDSECYARFSVVLSIVGIVIAVGVGVGVGVGIGVFGPKRQPATAATPYNDTDSMIYYNQTRGMWLVRSSRNATTNSTLLTTRGAEMTTTHLTTTTTTPKRHDADRRAEETHVWRDASREAAQGAVQVAHAALDAGHKAADFVGKGVMSILGR